MTQQTPTQPSSTPSSNTPDLDAIKARQQATWASGDFSVIGTTLQPVGEALCEALQIEAGETVLDVAAGNGNAALAAARRNASVTASDYVPALLKDAAARAAAGKLTLTTRLADAEQLPFADRSFDVVMSIFGVMFAPRQEQAASELIRVARAGGRLGLASWTPDGFVGDIFRTVAKHVPPPPVPSVFDWGSEPALAKLLGPRTELTSVTTKTFRFAFRSADHFVDTFRRYYGPTHRAFASLDADGQDALERDLLALANAQNTSRVGALLVPASYLEVVASCSK